ncbi:MAG: hypothetical protein KZQ84_12415 [Candidatus Thiodiazotropha sp. (ex Lucinoma borealis)]|nr:hypothetical protein [Candidatus Thiodiazotropha sp. (ex Lucinoma borealis)]
MLMFNLFREYQFVGETKQAPPLYPDEVLKSEWNPVLDEIHSSLHDDDESANENNPDSHSKKHNSQRAG